MLLKKMVYLERKYLRDSLLHFDVKILIKKREGNPYISSNKGFMLLSVLSRIFFKDGTLIYVMFLNYKRSPPEYLYKVIICPRRERLKGKKKHR